MAAALRPLSVSVAAPCWRRLSNMCCATRPFTSSSGWLSQAALVPVPADLLTARHQEVVLLHTASRQLPACMMSTALTASRSFPCNRS